MGGIVLCGLDLGLGGWVSGNDGVSRIGFGRRERLSCPNDLCYFHAQKYRQHVTAQEVGREIAGFLDSDVLTACDLNSTFATLFAATAQGYIKPCVCPRLRCRCERVVKRSYNCRDLWWGGLGPQRELDHGPCRARKARRNVGVNQEEKMPDRQFVNYYRCPRDGEEWADVWSCCCNNRCAKCGLKDIEPYKSEEVVHTKAGK